MSVCLPWKQLKKDAWLTEVSGKGGFRVKYMLHYMACSRTIDLYIN